jgi:hypothetical protein
MRRAAVALVFLVALTAALQLAGAMRASDAPGACSPCHD